MAAKKIIRVRFLDPSNVLSFFEFGMFFFVRTNVGTLKEVQYYMGYWPELPIHKYEGVRGVDL